MKINKSTKIELRLLTLWLGILLFLLGMLMLNNLLRSEKQVAKPAETKVAQQLQKTVAGLKHGEEMGSVIKFTVVAVTADWKDPKLYAKFEKDLNENAVASRNPPPLKKLVLIKYKNTASKMADYGINSLEVPPLSCGQTYGNSFVADQSSPLPSAQNKPTYSDGSQSIMWGPGTGIRTRFDALEIKQGYIAVRNDCKQIGPLTGSYWWDI